MINGFYLRLSDEMDRAVNGRIHALTDLLLGDLAPGVTDLLPGYGSLYVEYDGRRVSQRRLRAWLEHHLEHASSGAAGRVVEIPVRYDGEDLGELAALTGLSAEEIVLRHTAKEYHVYAMGFAPGFPFMGEVAPELRVPRLPAPRRQVPAHSVAIAGAQTGIYPRSTAGGWRLLGRALEAVYDPHREEPFLLEPGDRVRFSSAQGETPAEPEPLELLPAHPQRPFLKVLEPGLLDLIVDEGRELVGRFGLGRGGPLDPRSSHLANAVLGNPPDSPLIELNLRGPVLEALSPGVAVVVGEGIVLRVNGQARESNCSFPLRAGDVLSLAETAPRGCRAYLAIGGGVEATTFAGSASVDLKGLIGRPLVEGDLIGFARRPTARHGHGFKPHRFVPYQAESSRPGGRGADRSGSNSGRVASLRLLPGPQWTKEAGEALTAGAFRVVAADRVALRLEGHEVPGGEILSEGVPIGALQVPPGGSPIILLNDRGTLGGYAKPALLHPADLSDAGQLRTGDRVRFTWPDVRSRV